MSRPRPHPFLLASGGVLLAAAFLVPVPRGRALDAAMDLGHAPIFAAAALWCVPRLRRSNFKPPLRLTLVILLAATIGAAIEGAQSLTGRDASVLDVVDDTSGGVAGWFLAEALAAVRARWALAAGGLLFLALPSVYPTLRLEDCLQQRTQWPLLSSFESGMELERWEGADCELSRSRDHATEGRWSLRVELKAGEYPGVGLVWPPPNWAGLGSLEFDVFLEGEAPLDLRLKIEDESTNGDITDRFQKTLHLSPGQQRIEVPLSEVQRGPKTRPLDLSHIAQMRLYAVNLMAPRVFFLDDVRLVASVSSRREDASTRRHAL